MFRPQFLHTATIVSITGACPFFSSRNLRTSNFERPNRHVPFHTYVESIKYLQALLGVSEKQAAPVTIFWLPPRWEIERVRFLARAICALLQMLGRDRRSLSSITKGVAFCIGVTLLPEGLV